LAFPLEDSICTVQSGQNSVEDFLVITEGYKLEQNYPNPFNSATRISYSIPKATIVILRVYNITGRVIATLVNDFQPAGTYSYDFNALSIASGLYFYEIKTGKFKSAKKMLVIK
jgi:hypothetical protein